MRMMRLGMLLLPLACSPLDLEPNQEALRFEGRVTTRSGAPLEGATVSLETLFFVWQTSAASATSDAAGAWSLQHSATCRRGSDLWTGENLTSYMLVARLSGYQSLSTVNMSRSLTCKRETQRVDFVLEPATVVGRGASAIRLAHGAGGP
jgi:hypothetical protein